MNNLFGIGILLEIRDQVSQRLTRVSDSLEDVQTEADRTVQSVNQLNSVLRDGSSFQLSARESQALSSMLDGTSRSATSFQRRMQMMSHHLGGELSENTRLAYATMSALQSEVKKTSRQFGAYSSETMEARNRLTEFGLSLDDNTFKQVYMRSQLGLTGVQLQQQANSIKLNARMNKLMSSQTEILIQRMRGLQSAGVTPEMLIPHSTPGQFQLLNETIKASHSPIYGLSSGYRALGNSVEKVIKGWSAQKVAVKMANGSMERYGLLMRGITAGTMNLGLAFPVMGAMAVAGYGSLIKSVVEANEKLQKLIETVKGKVTKAFEPMRQIVAKVTETVVRFVGKVADMIIKFNEAHPSCAKIIQGLALLLPALTTLLLPLGMLPIGLNAFKVALNSLWTLIGPFVTGIGTASATALGLVSVIGILAITLTDLWRTNKTFRDNVKQVWQDVSSYLSKVCGLILDSFKELQKVLVPLGEAIMEILKTVFSIGFEVIVAIFGEGVRDFSKVWSNGFDSLLKTTTEVLGNITKWLTEKLTLATDIVKKATENIKKWWDKHGDSVVQSVLNGYNLVKDTIKEVLGTIFDVVKDVLGTVANFWSENSDTIVNVVTTMIDIVGGLFVSMGQIVKAALDIIKNFWDKHGEDILNTVKKCYELVLDVIEMIAPVIQGIFDGIANFMQKHGDTISTIMSVAWFFIENIIISTLESAKGFIEGILDTIGGIIDLFGALAKGNFSEAWEAIKNIFFGAVETIYNGAMLWFNVQFIGSIKGLLSSGKGLITTLWNTLKDLFSQGVTACYVFVDDLVKGIVNFFTHLPQSCGTLVTNLWNTVKNLFTQGCQWIGSIVSTFVQTVKTNFTNILTNGQSIFTSLWNIVKGLWNAGVSVIKGIASGFRSAIVTTISNLVSSAINFFRNLFNNAKSIFTNMVSSIRSTVSQIPNHIRTFMGNAISYLKSISLASIGRQMIQGLINGIKGMASKVVGAIKGVVDGAISKAKSLLGIKSPSRVFKQIGAWTSEGMSIGIDDNSHLVTHSVEDMSDSAIQQANSIVEQDLIVNAKGVSDTMSAIGRQTSVSNNSTSNHNVTNNFSINMSVSGTDNPKEIVDKIMVELERRTQLRNTLAYR